MNDPLPHQLEPIEQKIDQLFSLMEQLLALHNLKPAKPVNPFLPLAEASVAMGYSSPRALRVAITRGKIPPKFVTWTLGEQGMRRRYLVDVNGYYAHLGHKGSR